MNKQNENNESVRHQLLALGQMTQEEMIEKWKDLFGVQPPQYGRVFMRKRLAHRIQELFYGGLPEMLKTQMLEQKKLQKRNAGIFKPGNRIIREWHGEKHEVIIRNSGIFLLDSKRVFSASYVLVYHRFNNKSRFLRKFFS